MRSKSYARRVAARAVTAAGMVALCAMFLPAMASAIITTGISGTVTNAETHARIANPNVCLYSESDTLIECQIVTTGGSGEYTIEPKGGAGNYRVGFNAAGFATQYYNGVSALFESTLVSVTTNNVTPNINAALEEAGEGTVAGRVTNASNGQGAGGVEACAYTPERHCAETNGNGEYSLSGLPAGTIQVEFRAAETCEEEQGEKVRCQPKSSYIGQSNSVKVKANKTETLNVALQAGGQISGTVTNASITHPGLGKVRVCATKVVGTTHEFEEYGPGGCAYTNSSGQYTISGLESGSYKVEFNGYICSIPKKGEEECPEVYVTQFYHGKQTHKQAETVSVSAGSNTGGIDESLREAFPTMPASTAAPTLTGTAAAASALTCSQGSWSHEPTFLIYQWLRDGTVIAGQGAATYTLQAADEGHSITCSVWAGNGAGVASATSNAVAVARPLATASGVARVKGGTALVKLHCAGVASCGGALKLVAKRGKRSVVIGTARFSIAAGKSATIHVKLTATGRSLLRKAGRRGLGVKLTGEGVKGRKLVLKAALRGKKHHKK